MLSFYRQAGRDSLESNVQQEEEGNTHTELSILERDCCKQNFSFYDKQKTGQVERFELPMLLMGK